MNATHRIPSGLRLAGLLVLCVQTAALAQQPLVDYTEENHQIRRDKFDMLLPQIMREQNVDMWIHVMREAVPDSFGTDELGSSSGVLVFTDRGGDRIERAVLGRRWGVAHRGWGESDYRLVEESGAYDIVAPAVRIQEPTGGVLTEYDYRFDGLAEFVAERDPQSVAVNFKYELGPWVTYRGDVDGLSHTDFVLLSEELGELYASRLISSEWLILNYIQPAGAERDRVAEENASGRTCPGGAGSGRGGAWRHTDGRYGIDHIPANVDRRVAARQKRCLE